MDGDDAANATTSQPLGIDVAQANLLIHEIREEEASGADWASPTNTWHVGRRHGRTLYFGWGEDDGVGYMDTRPLAAFVVACRNLVPLLIAEREYTAHQMQRLKNGLHTDQTGLVSALQAIRTRARGSMWVGEGRGNYRYDDENYRRETRWALDAIVTLVEEALVASGDTAHQLCCGAKPKETPEPRSAQNETMRVALEWIAQGEHLSHGRCPVCIAKRALQDV